MRLRGCLAVGTLLLAGCVAAPETVPLHAQQERFAPPAEGVAFASYAAEDDASTPSGTPSAERSSFLSCNCKNLKKIIEKQAKEIEKLKGAYQIAADGFRYVTLEWIKAALFYRGYYGDINVPAPDVDDLVFSDLGLHTIRASQKFQCDFDRRSNAGYAGCDPRTKTGWLTFIEARDLICRGAYEFILPNTTRPKADPDLTLLVAEWYMKGRVYEQNPRIAYFLLKNLLENITYRFERSNDPAERERLGAFQRRALEAMDLIAVMPGVRIKDIPDFTIDQVCPTKL